MHRSLDFMLDRYEVGELLSLHWDNIDFEGILYVRGTMISNYEYFGV